MASFKKCLQLDADHFGASSHLANLLVELGEGERARRYFQNAIRLRPESAAAHFGLMLSVKRQPSKVQRVIHNLKKILKEDPDNF